jgi:hypothetical protein
MDKKANGLLVNLSYIESESMLAFQKWHNCEHMTDRVTIPGFIVGRRYRGIAEPTLVLMYYETKDSKVMASKPYMRSINNPTPWARQMLPLLKRNRRAIYRQLHSLGKKALTEAPFLYWVRFNIAQGRENETIQWFQKEQFCQIARLRGVYRTKLYEVDDEISNINTEERKIHGGGPGSQKYLALYELAELDLPNSPDWKNAYQGGGQEILKNLTEIIQESYWLDFAMYSPNKSEEK